MISFTNNIFWWTIIMTFNNDLHIRVIIRDIMISIVMVYVLEPCAALKVWPATALPRSEEARTRTIIQCGALVTN